MKIVCQWEQNGFKLKAEISSNDLPTYSRMQKLEPELRAFYIEGLRFMLMSLSDQLADNKHEAKLDR